MMAPYIKQQVSDFIVLNISLNDVKAYFLQTRLNKDPGDIILDRNEFISFTKLYIDCVNAPGSLIFITS